MIDDQIMGSDVKLSSMETKVFKANKTLMQMLKDRGYGIADQNLNMSREAFKQRVSRDGNTSFPELNNIYELSDTIKKEDAAPVDPSEINYNKVSVIWQVDDEKVNADTVKQYQFHCYSKLQVGRMIMIVQGSTPLSKKEEADDSKVIPITIEIIQLSDLQVNITQHKMVPKHSVLNDEEMQHLLDKYKIKKH